MYQAAYIGLYLGTLYIWLYKIMTPSNLPVGRCPPDAAHSGSCAPQTLMHLGELRPPNPLHLGACALQPLQLEAAPPNPCNGFES